MLRRGRNALLLPVIWFMAGLSRALPGVAMRMLLVNELRVQPEQQAILSVWGSLPWNFKMVMAFVSDTVPVCGTRRTPYLAAGLALQLLAFLLLASSHPTAAALGPLDFMQACGMVAVGTMSDTLIVESMKRDDAGKDSFGNLQANCWVAMFIGSLVGNAVSGYAHEGIGTSGIFAATALLKLAMLCLPAALVDPAGHRVSCAQTGGLAAKCRDVVDGCDNPRVAGAILYRLFLKRVPLRRLFVVIVVASSMLQCTQLVLITRANVLLGLPDVAFALGDDAVIEISRELLAMPMYVMMAALCPEGATSTVFALLTSVQMAGSTLAGSLSSALTHALGVRLGDYSNLGALTLVTAAVRLSTLFFVGLVPTKTTRALQAETDGSGRLLSSTASSDKAADHSVERDGAAAADDGGALHSSYGIIHADESSDSGYHYSGVLQLGTQGEHGFEGGDFAFTDPIDADEAAALEAALNDAMDEEYEQSRGGGGGATPQQEGEEASALSMDDGEREMRAAMIASALLTAQNQQRFATERGRALIFSSGWENVHFVDAVTSGVRFVLPVFFGMGPPRPRTQPTAGGEESKCSPAGESVASELGAEADQQEEEAVGSRLPSVEEVCAMWATASASL